MLSFLRFGSKIVFLFFFFFFFLLKCALNRKWEVNFCCLGFLGPLDSKSTKLNCVTVEHYVILDKNVYFWWFCLKSAYLPCYKMCEEIFFSCWLVLAS